MICSSVRSSSNFKIIRAGKIVGAGGHAGSKVYCFHRISGARYWKVCSLVIWPVQPKNLNMHKSLCLFVVASLFQPGSGPAEKNQRIWPARSASTGLWMLTRGPHRDQDSATAAKLQSGHLAIQRLYNEGKLKLPVLLETTEIGWHFHL